MTIKKIFLVVVGCISLGIGAVGAVLPFLPTFPFLMLTAICFTASSERLNNWFKSTKLYKNNLESYVEKRGMTKATKNHAYRNDTNGIWFLYDACSSSWKSCFSNSLAWAYALLRI